MLRASIAAAHDMYIFDYLPLRFTMLLIEAMSATRDIWAPYDFIDADAIWFHCCRYTAFFFRYDFSRHDIFMLMLAVMLFATLIAAAIIACRWYAIDFCWFLSHAFLPLFFLFFSSDCFRALLLLMRCCFCRHISFHDAALSHLWYCF